MKCWGDNSSGQLGRWNTCWGRNYHCSLGLFGADRGDDPGEMGDALPALYLP